MLTDLHVFPLSLSQAIESKIQEISHHDRILEKYVSSRWYDQSKRYGEELKQELKTLLSYQSGQEVSNEMVD